MRRQWEKEEEEDDEGGGVRGRGGREKGEKEEVQ